MNERMTGHAPRRGRWHTLPVMLGLAVALSGCGLGRTSPPAQLFDLGPGPGMASTPAADEAAAPTPSGTSGSRGATGASRHPGSPGASGSASASGSPDAFPSAATGLGARREPVAVNFSAAQMLTDTGVIWRVGDSASPHSYATYRWAAPPSQLVQQRVIDRLSAAGPVVQDGVDPRAPVLQVTLTRFEQVYTPDGKSSSGQVALQAVLVRDRRVVDSVRLAHGAPAPSLDAQGGVVALRAATDMTADDLAAWLDRSLAASASTSTSASSGAPTPTPASSRASARSPASASTIHRPAADPAGLTLRSSP
ncbi:ABC-type transport auxiliary lipoprotein family protein [Bordetella sp. H567]|uniref:ABC-type transport auxiliary lipoprotein family protein n=1 Tax=Bordetella sp. H567 TaxID=1697043 RepID=UPI00082B30DA|nr:ABC-type transport auxiliary lipoprotein family protein [Bordetella sp. H567]